MLPVPQSTALLVVFKAYLSSDHVTEATGKTIAITLSKNGGAFGNPNAGATNATEISSGWYKVTLDTTDTNTVGPIAVRGAVATVDDVSALYYVVKATNGGWTALPDTAVSTNASLLTSGTGTAQVSVSSGQVILQAGTGTGQLDFTSGVVKANLAQILGTALTETAGQIAAGFKKFFNIATPAATMDHGVLVDTVTTYTGNTPQTGDAFARIGAAGAGLTALGDTRIAHLDADTSSRMATYTQPTGFLAATFPGTVASPTNITAGTITTVTNLTNAPTAGDLTATMKASVTTAATAATPTIASVSGAVGSVTGNVGGNVVGSVASVIGTVNADIKKVNGVTVNGDGTGVPWGP